MTNQDIAELKEMARAYEEADENDYGQKGKFEGLRPDEIVKHIILKIYTLKETP